VTGSAFQAFTINGSSGLILLGDLPGWTLSAATGITPDGTTIVGEGFHNGAAEGWILSGFSFDTTSPVVEASVVERVVTSRRKVRIRGNVFEAGRLVSVAVKRDRRGG
jgi:hypothetical protein